MPPEPVSQSPTSTPQKGESDALSVPHLDNQKLEQFVGRFVQDLGAVLHAATLLVGDRLGPTKQWRTARGSLLEDLAERTRTDQRYVAEWLAAQAAAGYAEYDPDTSRFRLSEEQAFALTDEYNPLFFPGGFQGAAAAIKDVELITDAFRDGHGVAWGEHHPDLFVGTDRFFRPNYIANLTASWIPALDGVGLLQAGARIADIGCGYGASTIIMAAAYPASSFVGYDSHPPSIEAAARGRRMQESRTAAASTLPQPPSIPAETTTWLPSSTASTTWETRSAPPRTSAKR